MKHLRIWASLLCFLLLPTQASAAARYWVGGSGTWDATDTTHWSASSGGAGGASVPASADNVTFDSNSNGTITVATNFSVAQIQTSSFTGTLDFATNNNSPTIGGAGFSFGGTTTRTLNMGSGTWTINSNGAFSIAGSGLTLSAASATLVMAGTASASKAIVLNSGNTIGTVTIPAMSPANGGATIINANSSATFTNFNVAAPNYVVIQNGTTLTLPNGITTTGGAIGSIVGLVSSSYGNPATLSMASNVTLSWTALRDMSFTGGGNVTANNSIDLGKNAISGGGTLSIVPPSIGGSSSRIIGG